jgi:hypothetical protein
MLCKREEVAKKLKEEKKNASRICKEIVERLRAGPTFLLTENSCRRRPYPCLCLPQTDTHIYPILNEACIVLLTLSKFELALAPRDQYPYAAARVFR